MMLQRLSISNFMTDMHVHKYLQATRDLLAVASAVDTASH